MAFPQTVIESVWRRSGGQCECTRTGCGHQGRCNHTLSAGQWHAHHVVADSAGGADTLNNCEALCIACHQNTRSYGRS